MLQVLQRQLQKSCDDLRVGIDPKKAAALIAGIQSRGPIDVDNEDWVYDAAVEVNIGLHTSKLPDILFRCPLQPPESPRSKPLVALPKLAVEIAQASARKNHAHTSVESGNQHHPLGTSSSGAASRSRS